MSGSHKGVQNLNELMRLRNQSNMCISDLLRILACNMYDNSWVARDVTKNQTKKLSILLSFYFHEVLQYLNTFT